MKAAPDSSPAPSSEGWREVAQGMYNELADVMPYFLTHWSSVAETLTGTCLSPSQSSASGREE